MERNCKHCGEPIIALTAHKLYCDENCRTKYFLEHHDGYRRNPKRQVVCKQCGISFETGDSRKEYCSQKCLWTYRNALRPTTKELKRECPTCKKMFVPMQKRGVGKLYCSSKCGNKARYDRNKHTVVERGLAYRKKYKMDGNWWPSMQRDKWTCQLCGKHIPFVVWSKGRKLVVHHKDGSGETSNKNHDVSNLTTLCEQCHRLYHGIHLVEQNGSYFVKGDIFTKLGITEIKVVP
jgi:hypothetical protein